MSDGLKSFFADLERFSYRGVKPGLERTQIALRLLGHPQKKLKIIHIAGTNGKGSVSSLIAQFLAVSGHATGLSLSPHILDYRERAQFYAPDSRQPKEARPQLIPEDELLATHARLKAVIPDDLGLTYFEWSIVLALEFFASRGFEFAVMETGMGGRFDATNACDSILSGITTIGLDHMKELGATKELILGEKLEIAKAGSDFLFGPPEAGFVSKAKEHCLARGARYHHVDDFRADWEVAFPANTAPFRHKPDYFYENFVFAYSLAKILSEQGVTMDLAALPKLKAYHLPKARCQELSKNPKIILDGAHNEAALKNLKIFLDREFPEGYDLVFGCLSDRDFDALVQIIVPENGDKYWAHFDAGPRTPSKDDYFAVQKKIGGEIVELNDAFKAKLLSATRPVIVCGSLYLCAQFYDLWMRRV